MPNFLQFDFSSVIEQSKNIIIQPTAFYQQMPKYGGYTAPLIFVLILGGLSGIIAAVLSLFSSGHIGGLSFGFNSIIFLPLVIVVGCYLTASVMFVVWKLMGSKEEYETGFRCIAYSFAVLPIAIVVSFIPYIGTLLATIWWCWLMFIATVTIHNMGLHKSAIVISIIATICLIISLSDERTQRKYEVRHSEFDQQMDEIQRELGEAESTLLKNRKQDEQ